MIKALSFRFQQSLDPLASSLSKVVLKRCLINNPHISDVTRRDILQLNFSDSDEKVCRKYFGMLMLKVVLNRGFLDI